MNVALASFLPSHLLLVFIPSFLPPALSPFFPPSFFLRFSSSIPLPPSLL